MSLPIKLSSPATRQFWKIDVLHEDDDLLVLDKPLDLPAAPLPDDPDRPSLLGLIQRDLQQRAAWTNGRSLGFLRSAQRLEPNIGGLFVFAKSQESLAGLADQFGEEKPLMTFTALVRGTPKDETFELLIKLGPNEQMPGHVRTSKSKGKRSRTLFRVVERFVRFTLLECQPLTHRLYQLQAHLRHLRLPLVADRIYGAAPLYLSRIKPDYRLKPNRKERPLISQPALHATRIDLTHPVTGDPLTLEAPWGKDLAVSIKYLRRYASTTADA